MLFSFLKDFFILLVMAISEFPSGLMSPDSSSHIQDLRDRVDVLLPTIKKLQQIGGSAGISIGIMRQGEIVCDHHFGFADVGNQRVANSFTRYPLGSLTKAFVATTVSQLVHEGRLEWDTPITSYIPELSFKSNPALASQLTLTDLLSHQTGLARLDAIWVGANSEVLVSKNFTVAVCTELASLSPLRSKWIYNNWMYALVGEIIERVTHQSWGEVLQSRVLSKVGLSNTTVFGPEIPAESTALPYVVTNDKNQWRIGDLELKDGQLMSSAGGIRSNVHDMLKWGETIMSSVNGDTDHPLHDISKILSGHTFINKSFTFDELYTLGFGKVTLPAQLGKMGFNPMLVDSMPVIQPQRESDLVFYHNGALPGYNNCFMLLPSHQTVIVALLQTVLDVEPQIDFVLLAEKAAEAWKGLYQTMAETLEKERTPNTPEPQHDDFIGTFWHPSKAQFLEVSNEDGLLTFSVNGKPSQKHVLSHYHYESFCFLPSAEERLRRGLIVYAAPAWILHFERTSEGEVDRVIWNLDSEAPHAEVFVKSEST
ncbi:unnamed protein product [Penicillium salamii]|nr:unnamed protein product [Penicillium salamii]